MMLEYMGWHEAARAIEEALAITIMRKRVTVDFYNLMNDATLLKTSEFAAEIVKGLKWALYRHKSVNNNIPCMHLII